MKLFRLLGCCSALACLEAVVIRQSFERLRSPEPDRPHRWEILPVRELTPLSGNLTQDGSLANAASGAYATLRGKSRNSVGSSSSTSAFRVCNGATTSQKLKVKVRLNGKELSDAAGLEPLHCEEFEETVSLDDDIQIQLGKQTTHLKPDPSQLHGSPALFLVAFVDGEVPDAEYCIREFYGRRQEEPCDKGVYCDEDSAHIAFLDVLRSPEPDAATAGMRLNRVGHSIEFSDSQATHVPAGKYSVHFTGPSEKSRSRSTKVSLHAKKGGSYIVLRVREDERPWGRGPERNKTAGRDASGKVLDTPEESAIVFPDDTPMVPRSSAHAASRFGLAVMALLPFGVSL